MKTQYFFEINGKISSCFSCPFHFSDGDIHCVLKKSIICLTYEKPSICPLVELPPHGRLIDADKLLPESGYEPMMFKPKYGGDHRTQYNTLMGYEILGIVEDAPTVLEASKED